MHFKSLFLSAIAVSSATAGRTCGTKNPTNEQKLIAQNFQLKEDAALSQARLTGNGTSSVQAAINVKIYYHVVAISTAASGGYLPQSALTAQTGVLNLAYAPYQISFTQASVDYTVNTNWANDRSEGAMKKALHKGTFADLNVYFVYNSAYLGYAYYPSDLNPNNAAQVYYDGVVVVSSTVPGGTAPYNLGHTLTHESGHWFGLVHTFGDGNDGQGCSIGDFISDTPDEASAAYYCETGRDTCPTAGLDPIWNYMDYSDDDCFTGFTDGQGTRMHSQWESYRAAYQV
ncbi:metalloprotease [Massarina eburnea CBS 473.64]|uniref:Metalloprotease n=1 Tax=Massarina eburnea CBS 473.64 TaxID=1395130 RepID=A0A6A6S328_9PLEO|nr:metalloprotease [Massarina eburnea CBS 473.64]